MVGFFFVLRCQGHEEGEGILDTLNFLLAVFVIRASDADPGLQS